MVLIRHTYQIKTLHGLDHNDDSPEKIKKIEQSLVLDNINYP